MRFHWPWPKRQRTDNDHELDHLHQQADRAIVDAQNLRARADDIGEQLRATGRRNHFGEAVYRTFRGA